MFSYDGEKLIDEDDPIIIDYQLVNYGHPAYDLVSLNLSVSVFKNSLKIIGKDKTPQKAKILGTIRSRNWDSKSFLVFFKCAERKQICQPQ